MQTESPAPVLVNGIDVDALRRTLAAVKGDPAQGKTRWSVATRWVSGTRSDSRVTAREIGGKRIEKDFTIPVDEPRELCGTDQFADPQELLLASLNACLTAGYAAACALAGIAIEALTIETSGAIDLRGFLGLDAEVKPGFDEVVVTVRLKASASPVQLESVHDFVCRTSPNRFNVTQPVRLRSRLVTG
jgi:uncharacterized OsmC-like protein